MTNRAYEFRIYPNREQRQLIARTFGCVRLVYNHYLDKKKQLWQDGRMSLSYNDCAKDLTQLKKEKEFLKEVDSIALQQSLRHLDTAYRNFFSREKRAIPDSKAEKAAGRATAPCAKAATSDWKRERSDCPNWAR